MDGGPLRSAENFNEDRAVVVCIHDADGLCPGIYHDADHTVLIWSRRGRSLSEYDQDVRGMAAAE